MADDWLGVLYEPSRVLEAIAKDLDSAERVMGNSWNSGDDQQAIRELRAQSYLARAQVLSNVLIAQGLHAPRSGMTLTEVVAVAGDVQA